MKSALRERLAPELLHHLWGHDLGYYQGGASPPPGYYQGGASAPPGYNPLSQESEPPYSAAYSGQYWYWHDHDHGHCHDHGYDYGSGSGEQGHESAGSHPFYPPPSNFSRPAPVSSGFGSSSGGSDFGHTTTAPPAPAATHSAPSPSSTSSGSHCSDPKKQPPC